MKESRLISKPTQQLNQLVEEVTIKVPITKVVVNNNWVGFLKTRIGGKSHRQGMNLVA
jgi:hypothetical protein